MLQHIPDTVKSNYVKGKRKNMLLQNYKKCPCNALIPKLSLIVNNDL